jgi:hypothetical protein
MKYKKTLKAKLKDLYKWQDREPTRDDVKVLIRNFLWDEASDLHVDHYTQKDVDKKPMLSFIMSIGHIRQCHSRIMQAQLITEHYLYLKGDSNEEA